MKILSHLIPNQKSDDFVEKARREKHLGSELASGRDFVHRFILAWKGSRGFNAAGTGTGRDCALEFTTFDFSGDRKGKERNFI